MNIYATWVIPDMGIILFLLNLDKERGETRREAVAAHLVLEGSCAESLQTEVSSSALAALLGAISIVKSSFPVTKTSSKR
jgi:hypothetical protein